MATKKCPELYSLLHGYVVLCKAEHTHTHTHTFALVSRAARVSETFLLGAKYGHKAHIASADFVGLLSLHSTCRAVHLRTGLFLTISPMLRGERTVVQPSCNILWSSEILPAHAPFSLFECGRFWCSIHRCQICSEVSSSHTFLACVWSDRKGKHAS